MTIRPARLLVLAFLLLLLGGGPAVADLDLFGKYYDNVARAAAESNAPRVRQLLGDGHSPNDTDEKGRTGLHDAAISGNLQIAAILIKGGAKLDPRDQTGDTPLHYAAARNQIEMAKLLLDCGAPVDAESKGGVTPLMVAAAHGNAEIVQALLTKGAKVTKTDFTGRDAAGWALDNHKSAVAELLRRAAMAKR